MNNKKYVRRYNGVLLGMLVFSFLAFVAFIVFGIFYDTEQSIKIAFFVIFGIGTLLALALVLYSLTKYSLEDNQTIVRKSFFGREERFISDIIKVEIVGLGFWSECLIRFKDGKKWEIMQSKKTIAFIKQFWSEEETIIPTIELSTNMEGERKIRYINNSSIICTIGFTLLMPICIILYFSFKSTVDKAVPIFLIPAAIFGVLSYISYFLGIASIIVNDKEIISKSAFKKVKKSLNDIDYIELKKQGFKSYTIHFKEDNVTISLPYNVKIGEFIKSFWNKDIQNRE